MKKKILILGIVLISSFLPLKQVFATSYILPPIKQRIKNAPLIFRGTVVSSNNSLMSQSFAYILDKVRGDRVHFRKAFITFRITKVYKGSIKKSDVIEFTDSYEGTHYKNGNEYLIFANNEHALQFYPDNLTAEVKKDSPHSRSVSKLTYLEEYKAKTIAKSSEEEVLLKIAAMDELIKSFGSALSFAKPFSLYKGQLLEDRNDWVSAKEVYERLAKKVYESEKSLYTKYYREGNEFGKERAFFQGDRCNKISIVTPETPEFLQQFPPPLNPGNYAGRGSELLMRYGRALFKLGKYQKALIPLCIAELNSWSNSTSPPMSTARALRALSLLRLNRIEDLGSLPFDFRDVKIDKLKLTGVSLRNSNFSGLEISHFTAIGTDLTGSIFENTKLKNVNISSSKLANTNFTKASISGKIKNSDFSAARLKCVNFNLKEINNTHFVNADFSHGNFKANKIINTKIPPHKYEPSFCQEKVIPTQETIEDMRKRLTGFIDPKVLTNHKIPDLPQNMEVHGIGFYVSNILSSGRKRKSFVESTEHRFQGLAEVTLHKRDKPIMLVLTAYEPTLWRLHVKSGVRLAGIILGGAHPQDVTGVPMGIKVYNFSLQDKNTKSSLNFTASETSGKSYDRMTKIIKSITNQPFASFQSTPFKGSYLFSID